MHAIEKEITQLLKTKQGRDEDRQEYLRRLYDGIMQVDDDVWDDMDNASQDWVNNATKALKADKKIADFPDDESKPSKAAREAPSKSAKDKPTEKASRKDTGEGGLSCMMFIRGYLVDNPDATVKDIEAAIAKAKYRSYSSVTIQTVRSEFRNFVRILKDRKYLKQGVNLGNF